MAALDRIVRLTGSAGALICAGLLAAPATLPVANADPPPGCVIVPGQPVPDCGLRAYEGDVAAAGYRDARGNTVALDQGLDMCGLMDRGLSKPEMVSQFLRDNPGLGPNGAAAVVQLAANDLCPWHR